MIYFNDVVECLVIGLDSARIALVLVNNKTLSGIFLNQIPVENNEVILG